MASPRTEWPSIPGSMVKVLPPSTLCATPPWLPPTSQNPTSTVPRGSTTMSSRLKPRCGKPGLIRCQRAPASSDRYSRPLAVPR